MRVVASWSIGVLAVAASFVAAEETPVQPPGVYVEGTADAKGRVPVEKIATAAMVRAGTKDLAKGMIGSALTGGLLGGPKIALVYAGARSSAAPRRRSPCSSSTSTRRPRRRHPRRRRTWRR